MNDEKVEKTEEKNVNTSNDKNEEIENKKIKTMKIRLNGLTIEGTAEEMAEFLKLYGKKAEEEENEDDELKEYEKERDDLFNKISEKISQIENQIKKVDLDLDSNEK